jgi:hypothetical protein
VKGQLSYIRSLDARWKWCVHAHFTKCFTKNDLLLSDSYSNGRMQVGVFMHTLQNLLLETIYSFFSSLFKWKDASWCVHAHFAKSFTKNDLLLSLSLLFKWKDASWCVHAHFAKSFTRTNLLLSLIAVQMEGCKLMCSCTLCKMFH